MPSEMEKTLCEVYNREHLPTLPKCRANCEETSALHTKHAHARRSFVTHLDGLRHHNRPRHSTLEGFHPIRSHPSRRNTLQPFLSYHTKLILKILRAHKKIPNNPRATRNRGSPPLVGLRVGVRLGATSCSMTDPHNIRRVKIKRY